MKTILPILLSIALIGAGCATSSDREARCESYAAIYAAYSAASAARESISSEEIAAAAAAAAFLSLYCGWSSPSPTPGSRGPAPVDRNGVPIILPP